MRESLIEKTCTAWAKDNGWLSYKFTSPGCVAVPDRIYMKDGHIVFVEFKAPGKHPSKLQSRTIERMQNVGCVVLVISNFEVFKHAMS